MEDGHCIATVHAEANAILQAAMNGVRIEGGEIYTTASPCWSCFKLVANAGLVAVYFGEFYREPRIHDTPTASAFASSTCRRVSRRSSGVSCGARGSRR